MSDSPQDESSVVRLRGVVSQIGQFPALAGADLDVGRGEIVLVQGPNGAGKSTLLRLCAGLAPLNAGSAQILGHDLSVSRQRRRVRRETGLLAHQTFLYDELTVRENIDFWLRANRGDVRAAEPVLELLGLDKRLLDVPVSGLSAGQRRRTSLAIMVSRRPQLWLLDEPHGGLDPAGRDIVDSLVVRAAEAGATVLLASHDLDRARAIAGRVVGVRGGLVVAGV